MPEGMTKAAAVTCHVVFNTCEAPVKLPYRPINSTVPSEAACPSCRPTKSRSTEGKFTAQIWRLLEAYEVLNTERTRVRVLAVIEKYSYFAR